VGFEERLIGLRDYVDDRVADADDVERCGAAHTCTTMAARIAAFRTRFECETDKCKVESQLGSS
jgi:hypothetical protein